MASVIDSDMVVRGAFSCQSFLPPVLCIPDTAVAQPSAGAKGIAAAKLNHRQHVRYNQANVTAFTETRPVWVNNGTVSNLLTVRAGLIVACIGAATVTIDFQKNGASVLTTPLVLTSALAARTTLSASILTSAGALNDWFDQVITAAAGGGTLGTGLYVEAVLDEYPS
ncbi:MAG: hypothetical protein M3O30_17430 [Planctomycetota bacterium]|nr:hypothetical protein [Planctomycetota bacterium]